MRAGERPVEQPSAAVEHGGVIEDRPHLYLGSETILELDGHHVAEGDPVLVRDIVEHAESAGPDLSDTLDHAEVDDRGADTGVEAGGRSDLTVDADLDGGEAGDVGHLGQRLQLVDEGGRELETLVALEDEEIGGDRVLEDVVEGVEDRLGEHRHAGDEGEANHQCRRGRAGALGVSARVAAGELAGHPLDLGDRESESGGDRSGEQRAQHRDPDEGERATDADQAECR